MRRAPRNLRIAFDHRGLTHFGGAYFFHEFLQVLQMRRFLGREVPYSRRNRRYSVSQMLLALVYLIVLGLESKPRHSYVPMALFSTSPACRDSPISRLCALPVKRAAVRVEHLHRANDQLLQKFIHMPDRRSRGNPLSSNGWQKASSPRSLSAPPSTAAENGHRRAGFKSEDPTNTDFCRVTSTSQQPRNIQFGLKVTW